MSQGQETVQNGNGGGQLARRRTVMGSLAERYEMDPNRLLDTLKATCIKGNATNEQVQAFCIVANRYGLDPFTKEIHAFASQGGGIVPIVGIDGWSKIANSREDFDGCEFAFDGAGDDLSCTCTVFVKGRGHPVKVTEYLKECRRNTPPWNTFTRRMLRHKAFMQCVRLAFGLGNIYDEDEARDIERNGEPLEDGARTRALAERFAPKPHPADPALTIHPADASPAPDWPPEEFGTSEPAVSDDRAAEVAFDTLPNPCPHETLKEIIVSKAPADIAPVDALATFEQWMKVNTSKPWSKLSRGEQERVFKSLCAGDPWTGLTAPVSQL